jgi:hypothetical protein
MAMGSEDEESREIMPIDVSSTSEPKANIPTPGVDIPKGGLTAWLQVFGAHLVVLNCW